MRNLEFGLTKEQSDSFVSAMRLKAKEHPRMTGDEIGKLFRNLLDKIENEGDMNIGK